MKRFAGPGLASVLIHVFLLTYLSGFHPGSPTPPRSSETTPISMAFQPADGSRPAAAGPMNGSKTARSDSPEPAASPKKTDRVSPAVNPNPAPEPRPEPGVPEPGLVASRTDPSNPDPTTPRPLQHAPPLPPAPEPGVPDRATRTSGPTRRKAPPTPEPIRENPAPEPSRPTGSAEEPRHRPSPSAHPIPVESADPSKRSGQPSLLTRSNPGKTMSSSTRSDPLEPTRPDLRSTRAPSRVERIPRGSTRQSSPPPAPRPSRPDSRQHTSSPDVRPSAGNRVSGSSTHSNTNPPVRVSRNDTSSGSPGFPSGVKWVENVRYRNNPSPTYPQKARVLGMEGRVLLRVDIDRRGRPTRVRVNKSSGHYLLDRAALEAVRGWSFEPARRGGNPVPSRTVIPIRFTLQR